MSDDDDFVMITNLRPTGIIQAGLKRFREECTLDIQCPPPKPSLPVVETDNNSSVAYNVTKNTNCDTESHQEEDENCPICLDRWTSSGEHRVSALRCGHLFGKQ